MINLNTIQKQSLIQARIQLVNQMQSVFDQTCDAINSDHFEKELIYQGKTLIVDLGRDRRVSSVGGYTTEVIIRIFDNANQVSANQEDARISINGKNTQMFDYRNPNYQQITLTDFTQEQVAIMQFVMEDFKTHLASLQVINNEVVDEGQSQISQGIQSTLEQDTPELITDPAKLTPINVSLEAFSRLVDQVKRLESLNTLTENEKKSVLTLIILVLSGIFFAEDCYQLAIYLYNKLLSLNLY